MSYSDDSYGDSYDDYDSYDSDDSYDDDSSSEGGGAGALNVNAGNKIKILINPPPYYGGYPDQHPQGNYQPSHRYPTNIFGYPYNPMLDFVFNEMQRSPLPARNYGLVNDLFRIPIYAEGAQYLPITGRLPFPRLPAYNRRPSPQAL